MSGILFGVLSVVAKNATNTTDTSVLWPASFDFSFSQPSEPNTCKSADMCGAMKGICDHGTCRTRPCSNDIYCDCQTGYTGMYCDTPIEKANNGNTVKGAIAAGKTHVNGHINMDKGKKPVQVSSSTSTRAQTSTTAAPVNISAGDNTTVITKHVNQSLETSTHKAINVSADTNNLNTEQSTKRHTETTTRSTIHPDGSYIKGPESTFVSDNRPLSLETANQTILETANNQSVQNTTDTVTIPSTILTLTGITPNPTKKKVKQSAKTVKTGKSKSTLKQENEEKLVKIVESITIHKPKDRVVSGKKGTVNIKSAFVDKGVKSTRGIFPLRKSNKAKKDEVVNSSLSTTLEQTTAKTVPKTVTSSSVKNKVEATTV